MEITKLEIRIQGEEEAQVLKYREIFMALIQTGGLSGVKNGRTVIHFDRDGNFMGVQLDYWPWRRKEKKLTNP